METIVLNDSAIILTDAIISEHIGKSMSYWRSLFEFIHAQYPNLSETWKYYRDGKRWLLKVTNKSKTVFWLGLIDKSFRVSFYFKNRDEPLLMGSLVSDDLKEQFKNNKVINTIRPVSVYVKNKKDIENIKLLIETKLRAK
jgi:hypothetical protein